MSAENAALDPAIQAELERFRRGAVDLIDERQLAQRLSQARAEGRPLRVKFGMDPSSPDLHLGHAVQLMKLRDVQEMGHQVVLIVGVSTAMVGDPSGRNALRPQLTREQVEVNLQTYLDQVGCLLDLERTEVRRNSEWFDAMDFGAVMQLCGRMTVAQMLERDTFQKRIRENAPIGIHEFLYPLMQGWDSVEVKADIELGGSDQLFNLHVGRDFMASEGLPPQILLTQPLIEGSDGRKMSKSYGNAIGLTEPPNEVFGKVMAIADEPMRTWFVYLTRVELEEIETLLAGNPRDAKDRLAWEITRLLHGAAAADEARAHFDRTVRNKELPDDIPEHAWPSEDSLPLFVLLRELGLAGSSGEGRRLVSQGGVRVGGEVKSDPAERLEPPSEELLIQVGKRRFAKVRPR